MNYIITNPRNAVSAVRLGLPVVTEVPRDYDNIVNWGRSDATAPKMLNPGTQIANTVDKYHYLTVIAQHGVSCPPTYGPGNILPRGQYVMRPFTHEEGSDFDLVTSAGTAVVPSEFHATKFITPTREYRVWFANAKFLTARRIPRPSEDETNESCRSKWGYQAVDNFDGAITQVKKALAVMPLDFGAFDLLWATEERKWYILEVNSAPSLDTDRVRNFMVPNIKAMLRPEPAQIVIPAANAAPIQRQRFKVMTMDGWREVEI